MRVEQDQDNNSFTCYGVVLLPVRAPGNILLSRMAYTIHFSRVHPFEAQLFVMNEITILEFLQSVQPHMLCLQDTQRCCRQCSIP